MRLTPLFLCLLTSAFIKAAKEEKEVSDVGFAVAVMLLGSLAFFMSIFYLVNFPDVDIVRYSWHVISSTVSIFCAVLVFQSVNQLVVSYFLDEDEDETSSRALLVAMLHTIAWFLMLQIVLAVECGATTRKAKRVYKTPEENAEAEEQSELNIKAAGQLLAHMTGFAAINAFGLVQHTSVFGSTVGGAFAVLPLTAVTMITFFHLLKMVRMKIILADGDTEEEEEKWEDETQEAENEVLSLALSFLTVQAIRYAIVGELPDVEGGWEQSVFEEIGRMQVLLSPTYLSFLGVSLISLLPRKPMFHATGAATTGVRVALCGGCRRPRRRSQPPPRKGQPQQPSRDPTSTRHHSPGA